ncbi:MULTISPECIES: MarR family transcriptional regulator [Streptomyces]|uniref:MarR family transcriptional regulator n=2 Tax=Streptomyces rhizosphaericola TaxID=2564098 RepID=A0ABY2PFN6_9ACTN|nr:MULTISPECIES: MarR family transcriptional regulator [Streptomyces]ARI54905.1 DNA-binding protein [Streptomyces sp. S8]MYU00756.1 MarR family transcriptional regulator [Streptomyces sp. SID8350]TGZ09240.1 MarR family transcriptional regulator [Streptomyces rhizosphaericola]SCK10388.1 DNA-binding transcriptional regulator, MarR family [Streptomyces sp. AmelKG-D3]
MDGKPRAKATPEQAHALMDRLMALGIVAQHDIAGRLGLNITDLTCLGFVLEAQGAGTAATAGELAQRANLTTGAVTGVITRLERAGYARRQSDPADRRRVRVVADETAAARLFEVYGPNYQRFAALFADYSPEEIAVLSDWFTRATEIMSTSLDEVRGGSAEGA